jgi:hypothetical protein
VVGQLILNRDVKVFISKTGGLSIWATDEGVMIYDVENSSGLDNGQPSVAGQSPPLARSSS